MLTPAQKFSTGEGAAENDITTTLHYYSKIFPGIAWICILKLYSLGVVGSYLLGIQLAYSFANILPANRTRSVRLPIFIHQLTQITLFTDVLTLQYFPKHGIYVSKKVPLITSTVYRDISVFSISK